MTPAGQSDSAWRNPLERSAGTVHGYESDCRSDIVRAARELARRSRIEQGLPPKIDDPATLHRVAVLVLGHQGADSEPCLVDVTEDVPVQRAISA